MYYGGMHIHQVLAQAAATKVAAVAAAEIMGKRREAGNLLLECDSRLVNCTVCARMGSILYSPVVGFILHSPVMDSCVWPCECVCVCVCG